MSSAAQVMAQDDINISHEAGPADNVVSASEKQTTAPVVPGSVEQSAFHDTRVRPFWRRKQFYIPVILVVILVLFGIVFGAAYGTLHSKSVLSHQNFIIETFKH